MEYSKFTKIVRAGTPFATGKMMNSWRFFRTPLYDVAIADVDTTPYFVFNEEGTIYTQKNKGFISNGIVGQVNMAHWSEDLGLPYSEEPTNKTLQARNNEMLLGIGAIEVIR